MVGWILLILTRMQDPYLTGVYAANFVQGFQESPVDPSHLQASACCKHYDANSVEKTTEAGVMWSRHDFNANVTMQDLVDSYLPGFQACVEKGQSNHVVTCQRSTLQRRLCSPKSGVSAATCDCRGNDLSA